MREQIGVFDYLEFGLPILAYVIWGALAIGLGTIAPDWHEGRTADSFDRDCRGHRPRRCSS